MSVLKIGARKNHFRKNGFTLVETLIASAVLLLFAIGVYEGYVGVISLLSQTRYRVAATLIANEQIEIARNLQYEDVGISGGSPAGVILGTQDIVRDNATYTVTATVRNIDDPFDGTIGGAPNDTAPADYKLVQFIVSCDTCKNFTPLSFTTTVAPKNLEIASGNGALFIEVIDADGQPLQGVSVHVENNALIPTITIDDVTDANGMLQLVDVPPSNQGYEISVSKTGFSSAQTYTPDAQNPNPTKPHATVVPATVTQVSLSIDETSSLAVLSRRDTCAAVPNIPLTLTGVKLIGTTPDVFKYDEDLQTNGSGVLLLPSLEWDTYTPTVGTAGSYQLAGSVPFGPFLLSPGAAQDLLLVLEPTSPNALLVSVKDGGTSLPVSDALVTISTSGGFNATRITNRGYLRQTDWSGGSGQADFTDPTRYFDSDGNVSVDMPAGDVVLHESLGEYAPAGYLESSTMDTGASTTVFYTIEWSPTDQPPETEADSVKFQIAANNDTTTWNFTGPDGTGSSYYTLSNTNIHSSINQNQYVRYRVYLNTASTTFTPRVSEVAITFGSSCVPFGQVFFNGLSSDIYTVSVSKTGYEPYSQDVLVSDTWQSFEVLLNPQ